MNDMITKGLTVLKQFPCVTMLFVLACVSCSTTASDSSLPSQAQEAGSDHGSSDPRSNKLRTPPLSTSGASVSSTIDRSRILPILKTRTWLYETQASNKNATFLAHDYNDELVVLYALDDPDHLTYISTEDYERSGMTRRELRTVATENLKSLLPRPLIRTNPFFSIIIAGKKYESSLLLLDDLWKGLVPTKDELIVAIPARSVLLFTDSSNQKGIVALRKQAAQIKKQSPQGVTDILFVYRNGQFVRFD